jgi:hypothetical protein
MENNNELESSGERTLARLKEIHLIGKCWNTLLQRVMVPYK